MAENPLMKRGDVIRRTLSAKSMSVLKPWLAKWSALFPTHEVTKLQVVAILEALDDLTPQELETGCREATRVATQFPKPGHIREALCRSRIEEIPRTRPTYLDDPLPERTKEDLKAAEEYSAKLRATLAVVSEAHSARCLCQNCRARRNRHP